MLPLHSSISVPLLAPPPAFTALVQINPVTQPYCPMPLHVIYLTPKHLRRRCYLPPERLPQAARFFLPGDILAANQLRLTLVGQVVRVAQAGYCSRSGVLVLRAHCPQFAAKDVLALLQPERLRPLADAFAAAFSGRPPTLSNLLQHLVLPPQGGAPVLRPDLRQ